MLNCGFYISVLVQERKHPMRISVVHAPLMCASALRMIFSTGTQPSIQSHVKFPRLAGTSGKCTNSKISQ